MIKKLKFSKKKEKIPLRSSKSQGLTSDNKVKLKGNKKSKSKKSEKPEFKFLKLGKSSYPGSDDLYKQMARESSDESDDDSVPDSASISSSSTRSRRSAPQERLHLIPSGSGFNKLGPVPKPKKISRPEPAFAAPDFSSDEEDDDDFSDMASVSTRSSSYPMDKTMSNFRKVSKEEEEEAEKQDLLTRLHTLKQQGVKLSKNYTPRSSLAELRMEMGRLEHERETQHSMNRLRRYFMAGVSGMEYVTSTKKAPNVVKGKLNGFSGYVANSLEDYDPIFERMSEKYGGVAGIGSTGNPLGDLLFLLLTHVMFFVFIEARPNNKPPTEDEIKRNHPELVRNMARDMAYQMREEERQREMQMAQEREQMRQNWINQQQRQYYAPPEQGIFEGHNQTGQAPIPAPQPVVNYSPPPSPPQPIMPEPRVSLDFDINTETPDLFQVEAMQSESISDMYDRHPDDENLPVLPSANERIKVIEMPSQAVNSRKGKEVKIMEPKPQKNEITIE